MGQAAKREQNKQSGKLRGTTRQTFGGQVAEVSQVVAFFLSPGDSWPKRKISEVHRKPSAGLYQTVRREEHGGTPAADGIPTRGRMPDADGPDRRIVPAICRSAAFKPACGKPCRGRSRVRPVVAQVAHKTKTECLP